MGAAVAAIIVAKERQIVDAFRDVGATDTTTARPLEQIGVDENIGFRRLRDHEVIREAAPDRFYLDEGVRDAVQRTRRRVGLTFAAIAAIIAGGLALGVLSF